MTRPARSPRDDRPWDKNAGSRIGCALTVTMLLRREPGRHRDGQPLDYRDGVDFVTFAWRDHHAGTIERAVHIDVALWRRLDKPNAITVTIEGEG